MKAVFSIVDYSLFSKIEEIYEKEGILFKIVTHGYGSADSKILEYLGFGENKKCIIFGLTYKENVGQLYRRLDKEMRLSRAGRGIAFTVPVNSVSAVISKMYGNLKSIQPNEGELKMVEKPKYELIITIVERGEFLAVKEAAKAAGARGGTLIHGLGLGGEEAAKFLGIHIQPEKDIILIVVNSEDKDEVMQRIITEAGIRTDSRGLCFSLPVDSAFGIAEKLLPGEEDF